MGPAAPRPGASTDRIRADLEPTVRYIEAVQESDGGIPWFAGGTLDPWDHVEAAMGLSIGGRRERARAAYRWLARQQLPDGSWLAAYRDGAVEDGTRSETNFVAYVATGVWHHFRVTGDRSFLEEAWPMVDRALAFVLSLQAPTGEVWWALDTRTGIDRDALITGCSSVYKSLECGLRAAAALGLDRPAWARARARLGRCLRERPERFDRTWESKARYSMDWFYPVLTGVLPAEAGRTRLAARWEAFLVPGWGCRCVSDSDWVTVAESCELCLALAATGQRDRARALWRQLHRQRTEDGAYWTGWAFENGCSETGAFWPDERPTWTAGAVLLSADALFGLTEARDLFLDRLPEAACA